MFRVIGTNTYLGEIDKWDKADKDAAEKIPQKLAIKSIYRRPSWLSLP